MFYTHPNYQRHAMHDNCMFGLNARTLGITYTPHIPATLPAKLSSHCFLLLHVWIDLFRRHNDSPWHALLLQYWASLDPSWLQIVPSSRSFCGSTLRRPLLAPTHAHTQSKHEPFIDLYWHLHTHTCRVNMIPS